MHDVGSAVMSFLGDTTNLEAAITRIADEAERSMASAAGSVDQFTDALSGIGPVLANSRSDVDSWNEEVMRAMGEAGQGVKIFGVKAEEAAHKTDYSFREARGSIMLVGEQFGIHLPRELTMLLAHIPMVGSAFATMLPLVGVFAAIGLIGELIEKHEKLVLAQRKEGEETAELAIKQEDMVLSLKNVNLQLEDQIAKLQGRPERNQLAIALNEVKIGADALARSFAEDFTKMDAVLEQQVGLWANLKNSALAALAAATPELVMTGWEKSAQEQIAGNYLIQDSIEQVEKAEDKLHEAQRRLADEDPKKNIEGWKAAAGAVAIAAGNVQATADYALTAVRKVTPEAHELISKLTNGAIEAKAAWQSMAEKITGAGLEILKVNQEMANTSAEKQISAVKQALDAQLANIEAWKAAQHAAYESGKTDLATWLAAEVHAMDAAAIAHEDYLQKVVAIYTRSGQAIKAQTAAQELATLRTKDAAEATDKLASAEEKHLENTRKLREEWAHLVDAGVAKEFEATAKATEKLTAADLELAKAQAKLAEDKLSQHYKDQEAAIAKLAAMHLITEEQKDDRLKALEEKQATEALAILKKQLKDEEDAVAAAATKIAQMKLSPGVSNAEILEAEANLDKLKTKVAQTEDEMVQTQEKFNKQAESDENAHQSKMLAIGDKRYEQALLMAKAYGNELLAEQLKQNHVAILAEQAELAQAKARGLNTAAIEKEIAALKQHEQALEKVETITRTSLLEEQKLTSSKLLAAQAILKEAQARGLDTTAIEKEIRDLQLLLKAQQQEVAQLPHLTTAMQGVRMGAQQLGQMMQQVEQQMSQAFATAIMGALESGKSIGAALEAATKQILEQLATQAAAKAIFYTAEGIANSIFDPPAAAAYFAAAAEFALVAGVAGAVGLAMPGGGGNKAPTQQGPTVGQSSSSSGGGGGSNQTVGVTHLAAGGIVSQPTMFMAGDSPTGGSADEAILPLSNAGAMRMIADALMPGLSDAMGLPSSKPTAVGSKGFSTAEADASEKDRFDFGTPSKGERPAFDFSQTPLPRELPDMQSLAAQFGGLLSPRTLRAASNAQSANAAATAPAVYDQASMERFAARQRDSSGDRSDAGETQHHYHTHVEVKGLMDSGNLKKIIKKQNLLVKNRQVLVRASDSFRTTRRSQ